MPTAIDEEIPPPPAGFKVSGISGSTDDDIPPPPPGFKVSGESSVAASPGLLERAGTAVKDFVGGVASGMKSTADGINRLAETGADMLSPFSGMQGYKDAKAKGYEQAGKDAAGPDSIAGKIGHTAEQIGEYFIPIVPEAKMGSKAAQIGVDALRAGTDAGAKTAAQTGSFKEGGEAAIAGAGVAGAVEGAAGPASGLLKKWAGEQYAKVLHPLGSNAKQVAIKNVPKIMESGYKGATAGTQEGLAAKFEGKSKEIANKLDQEYARLDLTTRNGLKPIYDDLGRWIAANGLTAAGKIKDKKIIDQVMEKMQYIQDTLGPYMGTAKPGELREVRKALDKYVYKNGLTADESVQAAALVRKAAADSIRRTINGQNPSIAELDRQYNLWASTANLMRRNIHQEFGKMQFARNLGIIGRFGVGAAVGGSAERAHGGSWWETAAVAAAMGAAMETTAWRSVSAVTKNKVADYLAQGQGKQAAMLAARAVGIGISSAGKPEPATAPMPATTPDQTQPAGRQ